MNEVDTNTKNEENNGKKRLYRLKEKYDRRFFEGCEWGFMTTLEDNMKKCSGYIE